jgi:hypothetical protein
VLRERKSGDVDLRIYRAGVERTITATLAESGAHEFDFRALPGGGSWMGSLDPDDFHFEIHGDGDGDEDGGKARNHVFRWKSGDKDQDKSGEDDHRVRIFRDFKGLEKGLREEMSPDERREFDREMEKLREDLRELRRELRDLRDDRR